MIKHILLLALSSSYVFSESLDEYTKHFPNFYEYCTGSQLKYTDDYNDGAEGGPGGHGFFYVHGLCKDNSKDYPQVLPCTDSNDHQGVGISLDGDFKNVSWIAVPGRNLFLNGDLERSEQVNRQSLNKLIQKSLDLNIMKNVEFKPGTMLNGKNISDVKFGTPEYERFTSEYIVGTDLAVNWGRELKCVKIPIQKNKINDLAKMLNNLNDKYYYDENTDYNWSMYYNNCTHLAINASAVLGLNNPSKTDRNFLLQINDIQVPANAFMQYTDIGLMDSISLSTIKSSKRLKNVLENDLYLPTAVGGLIAKYSVFPNNRLFKTDDLSGVWTWRKKTLISALKTMGTGFTNLFTGNLFTFQGNTMSDYDNLLEQGYATNLSENLDWWTKRYNYHLKQLRNKETKSKKGLSNLEQQYKLYLKQQLVKIGLIQDNLN